MCSVTLFAFRSKNWIEKKFWLVYGNYLCEWNVHSYSWNPALSLFRCWALHSLQSCRNAGDHKVLSPALPSVACPRTWKSYLFALANPVISRVDQVLSLRLALVVFCAQVLPVSSLHRKQSTYWDDDACSRRLKYVGSKAPSTLITNNANLIYSN